MSTDVELDLTRRGLKLTTKDDAAPVAAEIRAVASTLTVLKFSGSTIGPDAAEVIGLALAECVLLRSADLNDLFTGRSVDEIKPAVSALVGGLTSEFLTDVDLSNNAFGPRAAVHLPPLLQKSGLRKLYLNNNGLGTAGAKIVSDALVAKDPLPQLHTLVIGRNRMETDGALAIAPAIGATASSLHEIRINSNGIRAPGIIAVLNALRDAADLEVLEISDNNAKDAMDTLVEVLPLFPKLRFFGVGDCFLENSDILRLIPIIGKMENLKELNLSYSEIEDETAVALAAVLRKLTMLQSLNINGNKIKASGLAAVNEALDSLPSSDILGSMSDNEDDEDEDEEDDD